MLLKWNNQREQNWLLDIKSVIIKIIASVKAFAVDKITDLQKGSHSSPQNIRAWPYRAKGIADMRKKFEVEREGWVIWGCPCERGRQGESERERRREIWRRDAAGSEVRGRNPAPRYAGRLQKLEKAEHPILPQSLWKKCSSAYRAGRSEICVSGSQGLVMIC